MAVIRLAQEQDLPRMLQIYDAARRFMRQRGNYVQWMGAYPGEDILREDLSRRRLYVIEQDGAIGGCFMLEAGPDPTYARIYEGAWSSDVPYGVIHRIAGDGSIRGILAQAVAFAQERFDCLRIDTHEKNIPMQNALAKQGFTYRGIIYLLDGAPRLAYDKDKK